jgi:hypothetical protein
MASPCANPALREAVGTLLAEANSGGDAKMAARLKLCMRSLQRYPLPLASVRHCKILEGFNSRIVADLERLTGKSKVNGVQEKKPDSATADLERFTVKSKANGVLKKPDSATAAETQCAAFESGKASDGAYAKAETIMRTASSERYKPSSTSSTSSTVACANYVAMSQEESDYLLAVRLNAENYPEVELPSSTQQRTSSVSSNGEDANLSSDVFDESSGTGKQTVCSD